MFRPVVAGTATAGREISGTGYFGLPTQRVGAAPLAAFGEIQHRLPMLSLGNALDDRELEEFDRRVRERLEIGGQVVYAAEPKLDGLAISLRYEAGILVQAATRGDGMRGRM